MPRKRTFVIDTNVAIVANGRETTASLKCQLACVEFLDKREQFSIALDCSELIMTEYSKYLSYAGQPGVGDVFFKYLHDNQYNPAKIKRVEITPSNDEARSFAELPKNSLDPSDRKFLAVAVVAQATVVNATDSDWAEHRELLVALKVPVEQLCSAD